MFIYDYPGATIRKQGPAYSLATGICSDLLVVFVVKTNIHTFKFKYNLMLSSHKTQIWTETSFICLLWNNFCRVPYIESGSL